MLYNSHQKEKLGERKMEKLIFKNLSQLMRELKSGDIVELELPDPAIYDVTYLKKDEKLQVLVKEVSEDYLTIMVEVYKDSEDYNQYATNEWLYEWLDGSLYRIYYIHLRYGNMKFFKDGSVNMLVYKSEEPWLKMKFFMDDSWEQV